MKLSSIIFEENYLDKYKEQAEELQQQLRDAYNRNDIYVSMGAYSGGRSADDPLRDKGYGKVTVRSNEDLPDGEYKNMKNFLSAKGYEITGGANFYEEDPDRYYYPDIKFEFKI